MRQEECSCFLLFSSGLYFAFYFPLFLLILWMRLNKWSFDITAERVSITELDASHAIFIVL